MKINILTAWKQDNNYKEKEREYLKRVARHTVIKVDEIKGEKGDSKESLKKEGAKLISKLRSGAYLAVLSERGERYDSLGFSRWLEDVFSTGRSEITFIVGSSAGVDEKLLNKADIRISLSPMTFPHQMARLMLIEQIYRAFTLIKGGSYHK